MKKIKSLILKFKLFLKSKKRMIINYLLVLAFGSLISFSNVLLFSNTKINISESIMVNEEKLKKQSPDTNLYCLVYPQKTTNGDNTSYRDPEKSSEIRSIFDNIECLDWYLDRFDEKYCPFVYTFPNDSIDRYSLCMFPKRSYVQNQFFYSIDFLAGGLANINGPMDIFISESFADKLLEENVFENLLNYEGLINKKINAKSIASGNSVKMEYKIVGVIEENESYTKYSSVFGDFLLVPEYFSLPMPCTTYIQMYERRFENYNLIKTVLNKFKYESNYSSLGVGLRAFPIEYRTYFFKCNELLSTKSQSVIECNNSIDCLFDYYFSNKNLFPLIVFTVLLVLVTLSFGIFFKYKFLRTDSSRLILGFTISLVLAFPIGCALSLLYKILFSKLFSIANLAALFAYIAIELIFIIILIFKCRKNKKYESSLN